MYGPKRPSCCSTCRPSLVRAELLDERQRVDRLLDVDRDRRHLEVLAVLLVLALPDELRVERRVAWVAHDRGPLLLGAGERLELGGRDIRAGVRRVGGCRTTVGRLIFSAIGYLLLNAGPESDRRRPAGYLEDRYLLENEQHARRVAMRKLLVDLLALDRRPLSTCSTVHRNGSIGIRLIKSFLLTRTTPLALTSSTSFCRPLKPLIVVPARGSTHRRHTASNVNSAALTVCLALQPS